MTNESSPAKPANQPPSPQPKTSASPEPTPAAPVPSPSSSQAAQPTLAGPPTYTVEDMNCKKSNKPKVHEIKVPSGAPGKFTLKQFRFHPGKTLSMSQEEALIFLEIDRSFRVRNSNGQIVRPRYSSTDGNRTVTLKQHEMVVPVTAVRKEHLYDVARQMPGGRERFKDYGAVNRVDLEEFIVAGGIQPQDDDEDTVEIAA